MILMYHFEVISY